MRMGQVSHLPFSLEGRTIEVRPFFLQVDDSGCAVPAYNVFLDTTQALRETQRMQLNLAH